MNLLLNCLALSLCMFYPIAHCSLLLLLCKMPFFLAHLSCVNSLCKFSEYVLLNMQMNLLIELLLLLIFSTYQHLFLQNIILKLSHFLFVTPFYLILHPFSFSIVCLYEFPSKYICHTKYVASNFCMHKIKVHLRPLYHFFYFTYY